MPCAAKHVSEFDAELFAEQVQVQVIGQTESAETCDYVRQVANCLKVQMQ